MVRQVQCPNTVCPRAGIVAVVADKLVARGVVSRPELRCAECGLVVLEVSASSPDRRDRPAPKAKRAPARR